MLRAAVDLQDGVEEELELLLVAHPALEMGVSPVRRETTARARPRPGSCRELLLEVHRRAGVALTPPEQRVALADAGVVFSRQAVHAATRKLVALGKLKQTRHGRGRARWEYSIAGSAS